MNLQPKRIAILGATGHIAKGLIEGLRHHNQYELFLFARSPQKLKTFLEQIRYRSAVLLKFPRFKNEKYDVIINCVGIGDPAKLQEIPWEIFQITETFDNLVLDYLRHHPQALYINISSGAVYGKDFRQPAADSTATYLEANHLSPKDYYGIAKINAEAKHRAWSQWYIVDLRVFGYFSRYIDLTAKYFLNEILLCIKNQRGLLTDPVNIVRDYVHPRDLVSLFEKCMANPTINDVFDVYSLKPVTKFEILDYFSAHHGLKYKMHENLKVGSATGRKEHYYSRNHKAERIGYIPQYSSLETVIQESQIILETFS